MDEPHRANVPPPTGTVTLLFTDIEGSTRLWEVEPDRMPLALARHDALARVAVESNRGVLVKMVGDGVYAAFGDALDAIDAALAIQLAIADMGATHGVDLRVRCGLHAGPVQLRDNDYFGGTSNRAARIMGAAHGGQILLSQVVAASVTPRLSADVTLRDLGFVRLRDLDSPERVYQVLHPMLRQEFPALRSLEATPNNLPQLVTSFIGRDRELAEAKTLLEKSRLLTLVGAGGLGKTRLSLQVAADTLDDFPDGVWLAELAPLSDERMLAQTVATVLGVKGDQGKPLAEALVKHVRDRQLLIIFDNCEHLVQACAELMTQLLRASPGLKVLASSREHLRVPGETIYQVPALGVPNPRRPVDFAELTQYAAVRLFIDRAAAVQPTFQITIGNAPAVVDICHRLDGIPLAIELAAARVRALSVETIAQRLGDRFRLLTHGDRTALPRQQTLRALVDWSYDLLTEPERTVFRRLAIFAGGWSLEAAEAVGADDSVGASSVLDLLTYLVEKSLVQVDAEGKRYAMLETIRQYAFDRLNESGEVNAVRTRHLAYFLALVEGARPRLVSDAQQQLLAQLDLERENLLSCHWWCARGQGGAEMGLRLVFAIRLYWLNRGLLDLGHRLAVEALAHSDAQQRTVSRCQALHIAGQFSFFMGRYEEAKGHLLESLAIARELGDKGRISTELALLGVTYLGQEDLATARTHLEEALACARDVGDSIRIASSLNALAELHRTEGRLGSAESLYSESLAIRRELKDRDGIAIDLLNLSVVSLGLGMHDRARATLLEAALTSAETGSKRLAQAVLDASAGLAASLNEHELAARFLGASEAQMKLVGLHREPADEIFLAPLMNAVRDALGEAPFAAASTAGGALPNESAMAEVHTWLQQNS